MIGPSNSIVGAVLAIAAGGAVIDAVQPSPPIVIEALAYDPQTREAEYQPVANGRGTRDPIHATWAAYVLTANGDGTDVVCHGGGLGRYVALEAPLRWSLDYLVGDVGCADRLAAGAYEIMVQITPLDGIPTQRTALFEVAE
jgi:hypothetical protein